MAALRKWWALAREDKSLYLEATWRLGLARLAIGLLPFRRVRKMLVPRGEPECETEDPCHLALARRIGRSVRTVANHLPWSCRCLVQTLAAKHMLDRRAIGNRVYIGVARDRETGMRSHAWVRVGPLFVTGREGHEQYRVITDFRAEHLK